MNKGRVKISTALISESLNFPDSWKIESIVMKDGDYAATFIIEGPDFPEYKPVRDCEIIVHTERVTSTLEVKKQ